ncbi:MAG: VWA domain-containing protein, partial [Anaerolineae bacterium]
MTPRLLRTLLPAPVLALALGAAGPGADGCRLAAAGDVAPLIVASGDSVAVQLYMTAGCPAGEGARTDVLLLLDRSSSMGDDGKLEAAKGAVREFVAQVDFTRHRVGLVGFTSSAFVLQPLTSRPDRVLSALEAAGGASRGTDIAEAIRLADEEFAATGRPGAVAVMLLLTDGRSNTEAMVAAADDTRLKGTVIFAVALGPDADRDALLRVAGSDANLAYAPGPDELGAIYERIAGIIQGFKVTEVRVIADLEAGAFYVAGTGRPAPTGDRALTWWLPVLTAEPATITLRARMTRTGLYPPVSSARAEYLNSAGDRQSVPFPPFPAVEVLPPVTHPIYLPALARGACLTPAPGADVVLALDTSDSMRGGKLAEAVAGATAILDLHDTQVDQAAVVGYDHPAAVARDQTRD